MVGSSRVFNTLYALIVATERRIPLKFPKIRQFLLFFRLFLCQNGIESREEKIRTRRVSKGFTGIH